MSSQVNSEFTKVFTRLELTSVYDQLNACVVCSSLYPLKQPFSRSIDPSSNNAVLMRDWRSESIYSSTRPVVRFQGD